ncbi:MAG: ACT domain-containing protein [Clostridia bacterium]|nr:ACT domain-containing protein [Clostridia bacterium]
MNKAVITVIGKDTVGIIAKVSNLLFENNINILDISQTIMQDLFTMIMLVDIKDVQVGDLQEKLDVISKEMNLSIRVQNEEIFNSMHRI